MDEELLSLLIMLVDVLVIAIVAGIAYGHNIIRAKIRNRKSRILREQLLEKADYYLEPYSNIWTYQKLVCTGMSASLKVYVVNIENDSEICKIKGNSKDIQAVWNDVLKNFSSEIGYDELIETLHDWHFDRKSITFTRKEKSVKSENKKKKFAKKYQTEKPAENKKQEIKNEREVDL